MDNLKFIVCHDTAMFAIDLWTEEHMLVILLNLCELHYIEGHPVEPC